MRILALYGSSFGQAEKVVERLSRTLRSEGMTVEAVEGDSVRDGPYPEEYDGVIVAASVIMGRHQRYVRDWVKAHRSALGAMPAAFVSVNGHAPEDSAEWRKAAAEYVERFTKQTGWRPRWTATFSGALRYSRYGRVTRWIMKRISASTGGPTDTSRDWEFTDWDAVDRFAEVLARGFAEKRRSAGSAAAR